MSDRENESGAFDAEIYDAWLAEKKAKLDNFLADMKVEQKGKDDEEYSTSIG